MALKEAYTSQALAPLPGKDGGRRGCPFFPEAGEGAAVAGRETLERYAGE